MIPKVSTFPLTTNLDNVTGGAGDDTITGNTSAGVIALTALDNINGGAGTDTLNITTTADIASLTPAGATLSNVEVINAVSNGSVTANIAAVSGVESLTATAADEFALTASATTDIVAVSSALGSDNATIDGGKSVTATAAGGTTGTVTIGGSSAPAAAISYTGAYSQADGSTHGAVAVTGGSSVTVALSTGNAVNTTNTFGAVTVTGGAATTSVSVSQDAAATASATKKGVVNGAVSITDTNAASATKAGVITEVTVGSGAAVTVNSGALTTINASGTMTTLNAGTLGALTTAAINSIQLNANGLTTTGAVTFDTDVKTINIAAGTANSTIASLVDASATKVNVTGDKKLTVTAHTLASTVSVDATGNTGGVVFTAALGNSVVFAGGAGGDSVSLGASTKAITTGAGDDTVTLSGSALGFQGSVDAGEGTDMLVMTAANAATASAATTFEGTIAGFERLAVGAATASATINLANLDDINFVSTADVSTGQTLSITKASSGFTLVNNTGTTGTGGISVALATATGTADVLNVSTSATSGKDIQALTATGFEVINFATDDSATTSTGIDHVVSALSAADATTITVAGDAGLNLTFTGTKVTSFDASGVTNGDITWTSGALAAAADVKGGAKANTVNLSASSKAMTYTGQGGVDTITTGAGADTITTAAGNDVINAGNGANTVDSGAGNDTITTGTGNDTIDAGDGNDTITAGNGTNVINAGAGNDAITGGSGADTVDGGDGTDTFTADNTEQAGSGTVSGAVVNLSDSAIAQSAVFSNTAKFLSSAGASVAAGTATYLYSNESTTNAVVVDTLSGIENVTGTSGADYIIGSSDANTITGAAGNDVMTGGAGADTFVQGAAASTVLSAETVTEAAIAATETITFGNGVDVITDFTAGNGGDILDAQVAGLPTSALGTDQTGDTSGTMYFLSGAFNTSTGVFTIAADGAGADTLVFEGDAGADLSAVNDAIVLIGVDSDDLVAANVI